MIPALIWACVGAILGFVVGVKLGARIVADRFSKDLAAASERLETLELAARLGVRTKRR